MRPLRPPPAAPTMCSGPPRSAPTAASPSSSAARPPAPPPPSGDREVLGRPWIRPDGRFAVFVSRATDLVAGQADTNIGGDVFLYDRTTGAVTPLRRQTATAAT